ncbi:hypothetical protein EY643_11345 [Halioglobus maricola]|uniref:Lipoprotein n=1 Tax=Halioglobus maricola TaxID=2601894 RepID=A0A5P9NL34_9GAMM|nr:hypothetical protein [Halioglobus maricola]QFU76206.1 hypothetical protein EY643_11345 [Halioglobus maricola]
MFAPIVRTFCLVILAGSLLPACSSEPERIPATPTSTRAVDLSGAWEVDYSKSETVRDQYDVAMRELRREAERRQRNMKQGPGTLSTGNTGSASSQGLYTQARMAELITDVQLLEITQDEFHIDIDREGSFALYCEFHAGKVYTDENAFGRESCGWNGHQLVFSIGLPEKLSIFHRLTLAPDGERLNIATTVRTPGSTYPFTIDRVYRRYDPTRSGIRCRQTLTKGRVCTTEAPQL